jgi:hypothetical protein
LHEARSAAERHGAAGIAARAQSLEEKASVHG